jgi:hypothetical protein
MYCLMLQHQPSECKHNVAIASCPSSKSQLETYREGNSEKYFCLDRSVHYKVITHVHQKTSPELFIAVFIAVALNWN